MRNKSDVNRERRFPKGRILSGGREREKRVAETWGRGREAVAAPQGAGATGNFMVKLLRACVRMPRHRKAKKDVANCEKLRGAVSTL